MRAENYEVDEDMREKNWKTPFFTIWTGQQISLIGSMLAGFALIWWVTESTGSATQLATLTLLQTLPGIFLGPFVGALVDRWHRRTVMMVADTVVALFSAWLAYLFWADSLQMWHVYLILIARAVGHTFHWPAMSASTSLMVPKEQLSRVAGLNQMMYGIWGIASPPLGALLISLLPLHGVMLIDVITAACAIAPLFFVAIPQPVRRDEGTARVGGFGAVLHDMREGLAFVRGWSGLVAIMAMAALVNLLLNPAFSLLPILVTRHFGKGALELSWMNSALSLGLVTGGLILSAWGGFKRRIVTTMLGLVLMGVSVITVGLTPAPGFGFALGVMLLVGVANPITNGPLNAIFQSVIPPEMQGRVMTLVSSMAGGISPLGLLLAGRIADRFGVGTWFVIGGIACIVMALIGFTMPAVMEIESNHRSPSSALPIPPTGAAPARMPSPAKGEAD